MAQGADHTEHDAFAESYLRRALITAELEGRDLISALKVAKREIEIGKHLEPGSMVDQEVRQVIDRLVALLFHCRDARLSFECGTTVVEAQEVIDDLAYVLGVDELDDEEEGIRRALTRTFVMIAGK